MNRSKLYLLAAILLTAACKKTESLKPAAKSSGNESNKQLFAAGCTPFQWVKQSGVSNVPKILKLDKDGNIYVVSGATIQKNSPSGNNIWLKYTGDPITAGVDNMGNTYVLGKPFMVGEYDFYYSQSIIKYDNAGNQVAVFGAGGTSYYGYADFAPWTRSEGLTVGGDGTNYLYGKYQGDFDFDPGAAVNMAKGAGQFIKKITADGNYISAKTDVSGAVLPAHIVLPGNGGIIFAGNTSKSGTNYLNIHSYSASGVAWSKSINTGDAYTGGDDSKVVVQGTNLYIYSHNVIYKIDGNGQLVLKAPTASGFNRNDMAVDTHGNIYFTGSYTDAVDADPGVGVVAFPKSVASDIFIDKYDDKGKFKGTINFKATRVHHPWQLSRDAGYCITVDANNDVYVSGTVDDNVDFDPTPAVKQLTITNGVADIFLLKLSQCL